MRPAFLVLLVAVLVTAALHTVVVPWVDAAEQKEERSEPFRPFPNNRTGWLVLAALGLVVAAFGVATLLHVRARVRARADRAGRLRADRADRRAA